MKTGKSRSNTEQGQRERERKRAREIEREKQREWGREKERGKEGAGETDKFCACVSRHECTQYKPMYP